MERVITVDIKKPVYGNYVYIRGETLDKAIKHGVRLEIIVPNGKAIVDPAEWKRNGKRIEKIFLRPDEPMVLYGGNVPVPDKSVKDIQVKIKNYKQNQSKLF